MRPESAFYFFKSPNQAAEKDAVTTLVTYRKRKPVARLYPMHGGLLSAMQKLYARKVSRGTLHLPRKAA